MGKLSKERSSDSDHLENYKVKSKELGISQINKKKNGNPHRNSQQHSCKKRDIANILRNEHQFISSLFEILELSKINQGRRNESDEDEYSDSMEVAEIPEQKVFKKQTQKKGSSETMMKNKSFPHTIEGLEKELAELKGTPMTYQKKLRKKGLQTRLVKKKRKEVLKLRKVALKAAKKLTPTVNGCSKTKPILNSDGNLVSNKFDFADMDMKKETKRKQGATVNNEGNTNKSVNLPNGNLNKNDSSRDKHKSSFKSEVNDSNNKKSPIKKENIPENTKIESSIHEKISNKTVFNKENKMVFSKVFLPESHRKINKKETKNKNPKKILEKLKVENKKISEIEKEDKEKATVLKEKQKWATALKRASGEKVKDDPELLRKSIAREKNKKMRSQKKWKARIDHVEKEKEERQKKRKDNIQARKNEKRKKKMKKAIKKGSYVQL